MLLRLAKSFNPGDADPNQSYNILHIDILVYNSLTFTVNLDYSLGTLDANGVYTIGKASPRITEVVTSDELMAFASAISPNGEPALITTQRLSYQFLIDHRGIGGTIDLTLPNDPPGTASSAPAQPSATSSSTSSPSTSSTPSSTGTGTSTSSSSSSSTGP